MFRILHFNTDFTAATSLFKVGFPLDLCLKNVDWPQDREYVSDKIIRPVKHSVGCGICRLPALDCLCSAATEDKDIFPGYEDSLYGTVWPGYLSSVEEGVAEETFIMEHYWDDFSEFTVARDRLGQVRSFQEIRHVNQRILLWDAADSKCNCVETDSKEHDSWDPCWDY